MFALSSSNLFLHVIQHDLGVGLLPDDILSDRLQLGLFHFPMSSKKGRTELLSQEKDSCLTPQRDHSNDGIPMILPALGVRSQEPALALGVCS